MRAQSARERRRSILPRVRFGPHQKSGVSDRRARRWARALQGRREGPPRRHSEPQHSRPSSSFRRRSHRPSGSISSDDGDGKRVRGGSVTSGSRKPVGKPSTPVGNRPRRTGRPACSKLPAPCAHRPFRSKPQPRSTRKRRESVQFAAWLLLKLPGRIGRRVVSVRDQTPAKETRPRREPGMKHGG